MNSIPTQLTSPKLASNAFLMVSLAWVAPMAMERKVGMLFIDSTFNQLQPSDRYIEYKKHLAVFLSTGVTLDGWAYVISMSTILKMGFDVIPIILLRFASGQGYLGSVQTTFSERHYWTYMSQFEQPVSCVYDLVYRTF